MYAINFAIYSDLSFLFSHALFIHLIGESIIHQTH